MDVTRNVRTRVISSNVCDLLRKFEFWGRIRPWSVTGTEKGKLLAFRQLMEKGQLRPPVLVFVQEKDRAKDLFNELIKEKIHVDVIHSERSQLQRDNSVRAFRAGQIWVLICTELMGRGIDFKVSKFVTVILMSYL